MKFGTTCFLTLSMALALALVSVGAQDEDLGALARAERSKREKAGNTPAKVLTNDDVSTSPPLISSGTPKEISENASKQERIKYVALAELSIAVQEDIDRTVKVEGEPAEETSKRAAASAAATGISRQEIEKLKNMPPPLSEAEIGPAGSSLSEKAARAFALMSAHEREEGERRMEEGLETGLIVVKSNECANPTDPQIKYRCLYAVHLMEIQRNFLELLHNAPPTAPESSNPAMMLMNQAQAAASLRTLNTAEVAYASTYGHGFTQTLSQLGFSNNRKPSGAAAAMIDAALAVGRKSGYTFTYVPHLGANYGTVASYELYADPVQHGVDGTFHYFTDQTFVLRKTNESRQATAQDEKLNP